MTDDTNSEYEPTKWVRIKHSVTQVEADGASATLHWSVESHDDLRAASTLRHAMVQCMAAHRYVKEAEKSDTE